MVVSTVEKLLWVLAMVTLVVFAVPWFLWGRSEVVAGLPVWLWWHIGWMVLAAGVFALFANRAWGIGIEEAA